MARIQSDIKWNYDIRLSAKSLYLIMTLLQYDNSPAASEVFITKNVMRMRSAYQSNDSPLAKLNEKLAEAILLKLDLHKTYTRMAGNLSGCTDADPARISEYLSFFTRFTFTDDFLSCVLAAPLVREAISAFRLLKVVDKSQEYDQAARDAMSMFSRAKTLPYLKSALIYPTDGSEVAPPQSMFSPQ